MLVYFVNHSTAPVNLGGAERSLIGLVEEWYASDPEFEALFITKAPRGKFIEALEERGLRYRAFLYRGWTMSKPKAPISEMTYFAHDDYAATLAIIELMEERRPDLVVTNTIVAPWGAFASASLGIPHAWFIREYGDLDHGLAFQIGRAKTFEDIGLLSQAVFTNSLALKAHVSQYLDADTISVVYPSVDPAEVVGKSDGTPEREPFSTGGLKVTVVGRLSETKGQWRAVDAIGELAARGIESSLCLVGSSEEPDYDLRLRARATKTGVADRITFVGEQANPFPYVRAADVCVTPSGIEAFGRTTLECMLAGKAVVASEGGGSAELVAPGETGFLFDPARAGSLSEYLERYAQDPGLIRAHGEAGARRAQIILGGEYSNAAAIERLKATAALRPYRLPNIARYWFELPGYFFSSAGLGPRITTAFILTRARGRLAKLIKYPIGVVRRAARR
jgi:glycosyltransferase involved in cell wall biosynthesis